MPMKTRIKQPVSLPSPPFSAWAAPVFIIRLHISGFIWFRIVNTETSAVNSYSKWFFLPSHVCLWGLTQLWCFSLVLSLLSGLCCRSFLIRRPEPAAELFFVVLSFFCKSQSLWSLQSGAAAEEKGKQMSDIPSASLFSGPACVEPLLPN